MFPGKDKLQVRLPQTPAIPQQLLASVSAGLSEGAQRLSKHLHTHVLSQNPLQISAKLQLPSQPISQRTRDAGNRRNQVLLEEEGVTVAVQARHNVHKSVLSLGAAVLGKISRLGHKLKQHHAHAREEGELRRLARRERKRASSEHGDHNPLKFALPWQRKRKGKDHDGGIFRMGGGPQASAKALIRKGQQHERELDVRSAVRCYEEANKLVPNVANTLCLAAKAWSDACYLDEIQGPFREHLTMQDRHEVNKKAIEYARQAIVLAPHRALPHVAACISMGRLAVFSDAKTKVRLAKEAREFAVVAMQKEPQDDLAQHLMGRWHWEMAQLSGIARALVRIIFGTDLPTGTHAEALQHYRRATELNPTRMIHRVELGRALAKLGQKEAALQELEQAVTMEEEDINAHLQKIDAEILLKQLRQSRRRFGGLDQSSHQQKATVDATAATEADPPKPWHWPQLPNPFADTPPSQSESPSLGQSTAPAVNPMPASLTQRPSSNSQQTHPAAGAEQAALDSRAAQESGQPFWLLPPWKQQSSTGAPAGSPQKPMPSAAAIQDSSRAGSDQHRSGGWSLPRLRNPFEGWGQSVAPGGA
ncbi:g1948 [Coccomyxa viridis]|uniref:G1948 protein n=1 Tax=Coccomyxa viridis TaxID=1274662 RepID=A0ABP1FPF4_9CHLO